MPIISVRVMKVREEKETQKKKKKEKKNRKEQVGTEAIMKGWKLNDFVLHLS